LVRLVGAWRADSIALAFVHFVLPFFALLPYATKWRPPLLAAIAIWLLAAHFVDIHWLVAPSAHPTHYALHWLDLRRVLFVGGLTLVVGCLRQRGHALVPVHDPALEAALAYEST